jgi:hypothetical protein
MYQRLLRDAEQLVKRRDADSRAMVRAMGRIRQGGGENASVQAERLREMLAVLNSMGETQALAGRIMVGARHPDAQPPPTPADIRRATTHAEDTTEEDTDDDAPSGEPRGQARRSLEDGRVWGERRKRRIAAAQRHGDGRDGEGRERKRRAMPAGDQQWQQRDRGDRAAGVIIKMDDAQVHDGNDGCARDHDDITECEDCGYQILHGRYMVMREPFRDTVDYEDGHILGPIYKLMPNGDIGARISSIHDLPPEGGGVGVQWIWEDQPRPQRLGNRWQDGIKRGKRMETC